MRKKGEAYAKSILLKVIVKPEIAYKTKSQIIVLLRALKALWYVGNFFIRVTKNIYCLLE